jgi:hypothetical protein
VTLTVTGTREVEQSMGIIDPPPLHRIDLVKVIEKMSLKQVKSGRDGALVGIHVDLRIMGIGDQQGQDQEKVDQEKQVQL